MSASSIVVYDDVILDECIFLAGGAGGVMSRQNDRSVNQGGYATANIVRDVTLRRYNFGAKPMLVPDWMELEGVYEVTDAGAYGFLIKDPKEHGVSFSNGVLQGYMSSVEFGTVGFGNGTPTYGFRRLMKARSSARVVGRAFTRLNGAAVIKRGGTTVAYGAGAGQISVGAGPSYVTFVADASRSVTAVTVGATTQVNLGTAISGLVIGGRLWLQDLTGADAALLNLKSHQITNIVGSVYTLATNTASKTITVAGTGKKYPQPDEALTVQAEYYVPVQFSSDDLDWSLVVPANEAEDRKVDGPTVELMEIREA